MEKLWSIRLIRFSTFFGLFGTFLGAQMAGSMDYALRPVHAHILLVGWLSVFAWGIFYKVYTVKYKRLVTIHSITAMIGAFGLTAGMWLYNLNPFNWNDTLVLILFIVGGFILLISFFLFMIVTFMTTNEAEKEAN
ncbi:hypothetical protein [Aureibacillus halotolerans]|uniref:Cytochrome c/quinol oxidase subunit I n=1 Tax=Aureibacillus halotolerans TaxID=1508390 RepID=A0A4V6PWI5_9BACI|nr:hypothetical protein [Aureibacillus halotolerans]TDQ40727.1 hypothetical protein EV213_10573 [Aureibacillus halotolerans]